MGMMMHRTKLRLRAAEQAKQKEEPRVEPKAEPKTEPIMEEEVSEKSTLTEEDINKMPFFSLKSVAVMHGIDVKDKKANQIRRELIKKIREE